MPSRFDPTLDELRDMAVRANRRAENLAGRIGQARRAVLSGQASELILAILDGKAERPDVAITGGSGGGSDVPTDL